MSSLIIVVESEITVVTSHSKCLANVERYNDCSTLIPSPTHFKQATARSKTIELAGSSVKGVRAVPLDVSV